MPESSCHLCALPCGRQPLRRSFAGEERDFCCVGCMNVYAILLESGVIASGRDVRETEIFQRSLELGLIATGVAHAPSRAEIHPSAPTAEAVLQVSGMWCSSCAWLIEHALAAVPGVVSAEVFFASDLAKLRYCPQYVPLEAISGRIARLGYRAAPYTGGEDESARREHRRLVLRLGTAAFLWLNIMALSTILYIGYFERIAASATRVIPFVLLALATPVVFYCAWPILRVAVRGARSRQIRMETLLALGIVAAYAYSAAQTVRGGGHVYFDTAAAIVTLVLAGKLIERGAKERATRSVSLLYRMMPRKARVLAEGNERFVAIDALHAGQMFVVKAGERVPADGVIVEGVTYADESLLTGESLPLPKSPGDTVVSGSLNAGGVIKVRATKIGEDSTLAQIIQAVERALGSRAPMQRAADRIARVFVPAVIVLAAAVFAYRMTTHAPAGEALMRAITVLVIACPCALGLATPLAVTAAIGAAARDGIMVTAARVLESVRRLDTVVLDKTGTVTHGHFRLLHWLRQTDEVPQRSQVCSSGKEGGTERAPRTSRFCSSGASSPGTEREDLALLAAVEAYSEHPLGRALVERARELNVVVPDAHDIEIRKGQGICGTVAGRRVFIGSATLAASQGADVAPDTLPLAAEWQRAGMSVTCFGWDGEVRGVLAFGDEIRAEAEALVRALQRRGLQVTIVSGDAPATTAAVAAGVGADSFLAAATPADKIRIIRELQEQGRRVAMVGDGVNDAPALAQADLGIALGSGADIAMRAAPVVLMTASLQKILRVFALAEKAFRIVRQNLFWAFFYNLVGITLAVAGLLNPIFAAAAMLMSSTCVVANSLRVSSAIPQKRNTTPPE